MKYIYKKIDSPNSVRITGSGSNIKSLIISNITDSTIQVSIYLVGNNSNYYILKSGKIIKNESLDVFKNGYWYDSSHIFTIGVESGSADILLILED